MKKITTLLLAAGMVFAASAPASAVDVKVDGQYVFDYQIGGKVVNHRDYGSKTGTTANNYEGAGQRLRFGLTLATSENLSGYVQFQDDQMWGDSPYKHGDMEIRMRQAYIDWIIPQTPVKVRMGRQQIGLPGDAIYDSWNAIMTTSWGGRDAITVSAPVADFMNVTAFWNRVDADGNAAEDVNVPNTDAFGAVVDLKFDGLSVSPYIMYANMDAGVLGHVTYGAGDSAKDTATTWTGDADAYQDMVDADAYWFGFSSKLNYFDPFTFKLSAAYGVKQYSGNDGSGNEPGDRKGWYVQAKGSYKTAYGSPFIGGWYASGDDKDDYGRQGWIPTLGGRFGATPMYNPNTAAATASHPGARNNVAGTWGLQAGIEGVSFLEDLTHTLQVTWIQGTNHSGNAYSKTESAWDYLTTEDNLVEFDLFSTYNIYKNLSATLELGYIIADIDDGAHSDKTTKANYNDGAWRTGMTFVYKF